MEARSGLEDSSAVPGGLGRKLRLGILLDSDQTPNWTYTILRRIAGSGYATIDLVVFCDSITAKSPKTEILHLVPATKSVTQETLESPSQRITRWFKCKPSIRLLHRVITKRIHLHTDNQERKAKEFWTTLINAPPPDPNAFKLIDSSELLQAIPAIRARNLTPSCAQLDADSIATVKEFDLDVLVSLGFHPFQGEILNAARFGFWSFNDGNQEANGVWEVLEDDPCTVCALQILNDEPKNSIMLARSWSATTRFSVSANQNQLFWKRALLLPRKLEELHRFGDRVFFQKTKEQNHRLSFYSRPFRQPPTESELNLLLPRLQQKSQDITDQQKSFWEQWILLYDFEGNGPSSALWKYKRIVPPKDRYWADPFPIFQDNAYWIFLEEYLLETAKGHISVLKIDRSGQYEMPQKVLEQPYHLSYPFVFTHRGGWYMIPETKQNRRLEIYECVSFPNRWKFRRILLDDVEAVDPTLFHYRGRWWMFVNMVEYKGLTSTWDELFVFYTDDPVDGVWQSHARNPIVSDVRRARPAGRIFIHNGVIYRPGQDCSRCYGYGIRLHEILTLTEEEYQENEICVVEPLWAPDLLGVHTLNFERDLSVADALTRRRHESAESLAH